MNEEKRYPRVLVIGHNIFSQTSNMGRTLANFFVGWPSEKLAQIYFHMQVPTMDICDRYYRITDFDMIKKSRKNMGTIFGIDDIRFDLSTERVDTDAQSKVYKYSKKRKPYMYVGRNLIWATKKWKNKKLFDWIDEFNPEVIFFAPGDYVFPFDIAMEIAEYKNIPILTYVCDDYYFLKKKSFSLLYHINKIHFNSTVKKLFSKHKNMIGICDKMSRDYEKEFGVNAETFMTLSSIKSEKKQNEDKDNVTISYFGNLAFNRYLSLREIGSTIKKLYGDKIFIDVYSAEQREEVLKHLTKENGICFNGAISYNEVTQKMLESDILIHVEAFDEENKNRVRYSVSTKIADSLSSGVCLLAYGPDDVASIEYLKENDCACVVTDKNYLEDKIRESIEDKSVRDKYLKRGCEVAMLNHSLESNIKRFHKKMINVVKADEGITN